MHERELYVFDDRAESFFRVGEVAARIARVHAGVEVDDETHERWRQLMALLREVDTLADDEGVGREDIMSALQEFSLFAPYYPALSPQNDDDSHGRLLARTEKIFRLGDLIAREQSPTRFTALRIAEGRETANLLDDSASDYVRRQPRFHENFLPAMRSLAISATLLDSVLDARADTAAGKIAIAADAEYFKLLASETIRRSRLGAVALLHGSVLSEFGAMSIDRLKNRMKHGTKKYSSLQLFGK